MSTAHTEEEKLGELDARLTDWLARADRGQAAVSRYLSEREQRLVRDGLRMRGAQNAYFWGGFAGAERKKLFCLPEYLACVVEKESDIPAVLPEETDAACTALRIRGSGYKTLSHRDYLGALLSLGIAREAMGDICAGENEAVVFCEDAVAKLILSDAGRIGADKVKIERIDASGFVYERRFARVEDTVASERLDCVVAALTNLSREKAREAVEAGLAELDFLPEIRADRPVSEGQTLSVRGYGKFILRELSDKTRKGRLRLRADKYL